MKKIAMAALVLALASLTVTAQSRLSILAPVSAVSQKAIPKPVFRGQTYRNLDGSTVIRMVSADELEIANGGVNLVCKYTKQDDVVRVVVNQLGTSHAVYYRVTSEGLQDERGELFYTPTALETAQKKAALAKERQAELAREAENRKAAAREAELAAERQRVQSIIDRFPQVTPDVIRDTKTGLAWRRVPLRMSFRDATAACAKFTAAGTSDWHMPTRKELETLLTGEGQKRDLVDAPDKRLFGSGGYNFFVSDEAGQTNAWSWDRLRHDWTAYGKGFSDAMTYCVGH